MRTLLRTATTIALAVAAGLACVGCDDDEDKDASATSSSQASASVQPASVGEPPTYPPSPVGQVKPRPPKPTVIASGATAKGEPFELVLQGTTRGPCIQMTFPAAHSEGAGYCGEHIFLQLHGAILNAGSSNSGHGVQISGWVGPEVDAVRLSYELDGESQTVDAVTEQISPELLREVGESKPRGVFVGFVPGGVDPVGVTATALDADGSELGSSVSPNI